MYDNIYVIGYNNFTFQCSFEKGEKYVWRNFHVGLAF